jgi:hypothetical protein
MALGTFEERTDRYLVLADYAYGNTGAFQGKLRPGDHATLEHIRGARIQGRVHSVDYEAGWLTVDTDKVQRYRTNHFVREVWELRNVGVEEVIFAVPSSQ